MAIHARTATWTTMHIHLRHEADVRNALLRTALLRILQFPWSIAHSTAVLLGTNVEQNTWQQKMLKGLTEPLFIFLPFFSLRHLQPLQLLCSSSCLPDQFSLFPHPTSLYGILPIASLPSTFPCKIIPLYFYNVVFHCSPYWMKQCVPRLHFPKGEGARCNLFGAHPSTRLVLCVAYSPLARSAGHNVQIINWVLRQ